MDLRVYSAALITFAVLIATAALPGLVFRLLLDSIIQLLEDAAKDPGFPGRFRRPGFRCVGVLFSHKFWNIGIKLG